MISQNSFKALFKPVEYAGLAGRVFPFIWVKLVLCLGPLFVMYLTVCFALILMGCQPSADTMARVEDAHIRNDGPPIWEVKDHNSTIYLYGTIHLMPDDLDWQKDDMRDVFSKAGTVFFEIDTTPAAKLDMTVLVQKLGKLPSGKTLSAGLDSYETKLLTAAAHNGEVPLGLLNKMEPWLVSEFLTVAAANQAGLSPELAADEALKSLARRQHKHISYLDTIEDQLRISANQPDEVQMELLVQTLERFNGLGDEMKKIAQVWARGDIAALTELTNSGMKTRLPGLYEALYVKRNRDWALTLVKYLEGSGTGFAAIGVSHLLGEDSLLRMLEDQGYEVRRYYAFQGEPIIKTVPLDVSGDVSSGDNSNNSSGSE